MGRKAEGAGSLATTMRRLFRNAILWVVLLVLGLAVLFSFLNSGPEPKKLTLTELEQLAADGHVKVAELNEPDDKVKGELDTGQKFEAKYPAEYADELTTKLRGDLAPDGKPLVVEAKHNEGNLLVSLLVNFLPFVLLFGLFFFVLNQMQGGGNRVMQFGKAKTKQVSKDQPKVTFADVAGCEEAIEELQEIKEFLEAPARFHAMGAKIPKGVLLFGPPGTGKTLLARAVAGEAGVPFFSISGSDFVEMFVGVGASRVRDLFEQAKAAAPAIIFMDEIDAVGRHRGAGLGGGHDEREQTLNQLLVEMDGFDAKTGVILIAATNRPDILDPALLRPGRFDRQIVVDRPDLAGRKNILDIHAKGKPLAKGVDLDTLAKRTPGFTGADLGNLLNEAALLAARHGFSEIGFMQLDEAIDRVLAGPERKNRIMSEKERRLTAYHEGGHALVGHVLPDADEVHKVSIVSRGRALGLTWSLPEDRYSNNRAQLRSMMSMSLGGRTAEELVFGEITTGASNDIEKATEIARAMVTQYGMSDRLGPRKFGQEQGEVFLGREVGHQRDYSDDIAKLIDEEIDALIDMAHLEATDILTTHRATLDRLASLLLEKETLNADELAEIFKDLPPWQRRPGAMVASRPQATVTPLRSPSSASAMEDDAPTPPRTQSGGSSPTGKKRWLDRLRGTVGPSPA
jgi:cell division protease FtsH